MLQCIGLTLASLQLLVFLTKTPQRFAWTAATIGTLIELLTPITWTLQAVAAFPRGWAPTLRDTPVRGFQSFPGAGYVMFGAVLASVYRYYSTNPQGFSLWKLAGVGGVLVMVGTGLQRLPVIIYRLCRILGETS